MRKRVLVIDDDAHLCALVAAVLGSAGYEVRSASGGADGLALASAETPDIVLLDLEMPGIDGYEVCRRLRRGSKTGTIPVVMLTGSDDPHLNREAFAAGAQACVPKPFRKDSLIAVIETALAGKSLSTGSQPTFPRPPLSKGGGKDQDGGGGTKRILPLTNEDP